MFNIELTFRAQRAGFRVTEVPITYHERTAGESKISLGIAIEALWLVPVLRLPSRASFRRGAQAGASPAAGPPAAGP